MATVHLVSPAGCRFELLEARVCPCVGLDMPILVARSDNSTLYLSYWLFLAEGWRFVARPQLRNDASGDCAQKFGAA